MKEIEVEGKTVEEAISQALAELKTTIEQVDIKIINEGKAGLFGLMGATPALVKVSLKEDAGTNNEISVQAKTIIDTILAKMQVDGETKITVEDNKILVDVDSIDSALLIGKKGQTLEAFQYIVNLIINKEIKAGTYKGITLENKYKIIIDTEGYLIRREEALVKMAKNMADKVKQARTKIALEPMSAHDRRVIHLALQEISGIKTESEGEGSFRRIVIYPAEA
ncbi:MAG: protein jag [bacterium]|nr:protein jag [bacterium]MDD5756571.1 protein jag [bacterium]